ncbi:MAG: hypothetical protein OXF27_03540 [Acidobacteria bacterium]|nr:hypothetical protein [Acidobacteriota bacterium]
MNRALERLSPRRVLALPLACAVSVAVFYWLPAAHRSPPLAWSLLGAAGMLAGWQALLLLGAGGSGRRFTILLQPRAQHYLQACAQASVLLYWGWHWRPVYDHLPLLAAQLLFAYGFDMLLAWSRRDTYVLGFGPFPIIIGINLFLWFEPDWFVFQFLLIAAGLGAKELLRWERDGRRVHIFNPSSLPLALGSLVLLLTGTTDLTLGQEIATTFDIPPYIGLWIFLIALPGQLAFGVASMTMAATVTLFGLGAAYHAVTGTYFFVDSYIPAAVFLGMNLLFTDPSTSPRTELGRLVFGVLYGLSVAALYAVLEAAGAPTFYDKLLAVPLLNLAVQSIDRWARSDAVRRLNPAAVGRALSPRRRHLAYMAIWTAAFLPINALEGVGDVSEAGLPLWRRACDRGRPEACRALAATYAPECVAGSPRACNELGILSAKGLASTPLPAAEAFARACSLGLPEGCANAEALASGVRTWRRPPGN